MRRAFVYVLALAGSLAVLVAVECLLQPAQIEAQVPTAPTGVPNADIVVRRSPNLAIPFYATANTNAARGLALRAAVAAAQSGDFIELGPATFDVTKNAAGNNVHFAFPAGVTVRGKGKLRTTVQSNANLSDINTETGGAANYCTFEVYNGAAVEDMTLAGTRTDGSVQALVGAQDSSNASATVYFRRIRVTGQSDGFYIWGGSHYAMIANECDVVTTWDNLAILGSGGQGYSFTGYNCTFSASLPFAGGAGTRTGECQCINNESGAVTLYNCTLAYSGSDAASFAVRNVATGNPGGATASTTLVGCVSTISASSGLGAGTDAYTYASNATLSVTAGKGSNNDGRYTGVSYQTPTSLATPGAGQAKPTITVGGFALPNPAPRNIYLSNVTTTGGVTLYTPTTGRTGLVLRYGIANPTSQSTGAVTANLNIKQSTTTAPLTASQSIAQGTEVSGQLSVAMVSNTSILLNAAAAGLNIWLSVIEFDTASSGATALRSVFKRSGWATGNNTIYTVPTGLNGGAYLLDANAGSGLSGGQVFVANGIGSSITTYAHIVPSGQSVSDAYLAAVSTSCPTAALTALPMPGALGVGDFVNLNISGTGAPLMAWVTVLEY